MTIEGTDLGVGWSMFFAKGLRLSCSLAVLSGCIAAQCYDLTAVHLYDLKGRFQERWDKPIWDAKPGEGNFHLDESPWMGGISEFIIFAIGQVQKTGSDWAPLRKSRAGEHWCRMAPERSSYFFCYWVPYETPPPGAFRAPPLDEERETWSLGRDGLLRYTHSTRGESTLDHIDYTHDFGSTFEAVLDLNTGAYSTVEHGHSSGHYTKRIPGGVEVWRDTTLSARAVLIPKDCGASVTKAGFVSSGAMREEKAHPVPICVARAREAGSHTSFEFTLNPKKVNSPDGCIVAHDGPVPSNSRVAEPPNR